MSKIIYCIFLKKYSESLDTPCYPGKLGERIYKNISKIAWEQWKNKQTILINENKLNLMYPSDRKKLEVAMENFLFNSQCCNKKYNQLN